MFDTYFSQYAVCMDAADLFVRIGWCPDKVKVTIVDTGAGVTWFRPMGNDSGLDRVAAGDLTGNTDKGIKLCKFDYGTPKDQNAAATDPSEVQPEKWYEADGVIVTSDATFLADDKVVLVEAWRTNHGHVIKAIADGGSNSNTYFEDGSIDFLAAGVKQGDIVYNQSNGNYCYVKSIIKPVGEKNFCRIYTSTDQAGENATAAADFDDNDVIFIFPAESMWYPLSDVGAMT